MVYIMGIRNYTDRPFIHSFPLHKMAFDNINTVEDFTLQIAKLRFSDNPEDRALLAAMEAGRRPVDPKYQPLFEQMIRVRSRSNNAVKKKWLMHAAGMGDADGHEGEEEEEEKPKHDDKRIRRLGDPDYAYTFEERLRDSGPFLYHGPAPRAPDEPSDEINFLKERLKSFAQVTEEQQQQPTPLPPQ